MDNAEQSPRPPPKGIFDTASLLAPSSTIFSSQSPSSVQSPLPHLAHSPSAFSVLGRTTVFVPPPSTNSDSSALSTSGKICSSVIHQSASDALSSLASSSGPCGWWPGGSPVVTTADFPGCGVSSIGEPYGRTGMCGRSPISLGSSIHLPLPQPRRIVEEVLGHLYAKPPSAEVKAEPQSSGIHGTHQLSCKTSTPVNFQSATQKSPSKLKPNSSSEKEVNSGKTHEKQKSTLNSVQVFPVNSPVDGNTFSKSAARKASDIMSEQSLESVIPRNSSNRTKKRLKNSNKSDSSKNGRRNKGLNRNKTESNRKSKEDTQKQLSSDSESHIGSSSSSSSSATSGVDSSSSSDSSDDDEEREKTQKELERLKKQQQELRRKVQELKQASHDSSHQKPESHAKRTASSKNPVNNNISVNKVGKPVPSPAHSSSIRSASPKTPPAKSKPMVNSLGDEDVPMPAPLDLCMKKQEPTFEVTNSSSHGSYNSAPNLSKRPAKAAAGNATSGLKPPVVEKKKRGRKPKSLSLPVTNSLGSDIVHHLKQNASKEHTIKIPQEMLLIPPASVISFNSVSQAKNGSSVVSSKTPLTASNVPEPFSTRRKDFTLDSLLGEANSPSETISFHIGNDAHVLPSSSVNSKSVRNRDRGHSSNQVKKLEEKNHGYESQEKNDSSSVSDSEQENEDSDSDTEKSASGSTVGNVASSTSRHCHKRLFEEDGEVDSSSKRKRILPDEKDIMIPLEHGWRRQTKIRCFSRSGVRGEVAYYAPCGKKLRNYPEVIRYLIKHGISDINRENFSFSTKINIGEFLESTSSGSGEDYVLLSEQEVIARIDEVRARKGRLGVQVRKSHQRSAEEEEQQRQWEQKQLQHQLEQQEMARRAQELKMMVQLQREHVLMAAKEEKKQKAEEARRQKEHQRLLKQQERFERLEQLRIEREIRAQQLLEEQEMKRQQAAFLREQELQKRREMLLMVDLERERRRQHMMLVRALEARKKQEERERKREEILFEKRMNKEKKLEQRRMELDYLRELKKPVEDMMLKDTAPLPTLNRIPGVKLCSKAYGDALMVFEFLHNFGETLGFDVESLPTLNTMQMAMLNLDEKCEEELLSVIHHLLVCVIDDPGVPHSAESATVLGQNLKDADITNNNVSEVLRLYFIAQDKKNKMCQWLQDKPFLSLNSTQKGEIMAHLCNDLLCSRLLIRQIDNNIENVNVLRKDKWIIEGELRKMKTIQQRRALKLQQNCDETKKELSSGEGQASSEVMEISMQSDTVKDNSSKDVLAAEDSEIKDTTKSEKDKFEELDNEVGNESGNESDDTQATGQVSDGEDEDLHLSNEELSKKVEKLTKQLNTFSAKLVKACHTLRGVTLGLDRNHRRYWVLPKSGGVFVESMETSEFMLDSSLAAHEDQKEPNSGDMNAELDSSLVIGGNLNTTDVQQDVKVSVSDMEVSSTDVVTSSTTSVVTSVSNVNVVASSASVITNINTSVVTNTDSSVVIDNSNTSAIASSNTSTGTNNNTTSSDKPKISDSKENIQSKLLPVDDSPKTSSTQDSVDEISTKTEPKCSEPILLPVSETKEVKEVTQSTESECKKSVESKTCEKDIDKIEKTEKKPEVNIFMPKFFDNSLGLDPVTLRNHSLHGQCERKPNITNSSIPLEQNFLLHSPFFASLLAGNMLFNGPMMHGRELNGTYFNLPKGDSNNPFGPFLGLPSNMMSTEQIVKSLNEKQSSQKAWFNILPRMPCDENSLNNQLSKNCIATSVASTVSSTICTSNASSPSKSAPHITHSTPVSASSNHSGSTTPVSAALSNLQMDMLNGMPSGFFMHPFLPPQFGPAYQNSPPVTASQSHQSSFVSNMSHSSPITDFNLNLSHPPAASTPSSIPTPSDTPGPSTQDSAVRDSPSPSPSFVKRLQMEKMTQEYEKPQAIPVELQRGWWRITDPSQLKALLNALHHRGIREKMLQKQLQKHFIYACNSCSQGNSDGLKFFQRDGRNYIHKVRKIEHRNRFVYTAVNYKLKTQDTDLEITDLDREISHLPGGAPVADGEDSWNPEVALRVDLSILEQIENLEEKVGGASMQVKGWKPPPKLSVEPLSTFAPACEKYLHLRGNSETVESVLLVSKPKSKGSKKKSNKKQKTSKVDKDSSETNSLQKTDVPETDQKVGVTDCSEGKIQTVTEEPCKEDPEEVPQQLASNKIDPVEIAKTRLLMVEAAIERRYLRHPLGININELNLSSMSNNGPNSHSSSEEKLEIPPIPPGLIKWRDAVKKCRTSAQLAICLNFLESCTAWDKSIMRASCQFCHSGESEDMLLLCDGCDKGYHTYCFKPKMEAIPEGDWYCYECLNKATGDKVCVICGNKGKLLECESCPKTFHLACLEPPLTKMPKGKWYCSGCSHNKPKKSSKKSNNNKEKESTKEPKENSGSKKAEGSQPSKSKSAEKKDKKEKSKGNMDLTPCSTIVEELEKHEDAWPFLLPVNTKQFPTYRKVIKKPMDLSTMRSKLDSNVYKSREEFAADTRLIFDNCETFNEDDSPVGQAGHSLRAFFETRWAELCGS